MTIKLIPKCKSKFIQFFNCYILNKITQSRMSSIASCSCLYSSVFFLSVVSLPNIQPGLCSFQRVFVFRVFFKFLNYALVRQSKPTVSHFLFSFCAQTWRFPSVSMATSVLHCIGYTVLAPYNLFMHSSLTNQNLGNLLSIQ